MIQKIQNRPRLSRPYVKDNAEALPEKGNIEKQRPITDAATCVWKTQNHKKKEKIQIHVHMYVVLDVCICICFFQEFSIKGNI